MMCDDDNDGQMIFGDLGDLKLPDSCLTDEEKPRKNLTQETCPDRGSNPGSLRDERACCRLAHSGGRNFKEHVVATRPQTLDELRDQNEHAINDIPLVTIQTICRSVRRLCWEYTVAKGGHFEYVRA